MGIRSPRPRWRPMLGGLICLLLLGGLLAAGPSVEAHGLFNLTPTVEPTEIPTNTPTNTPTDTPTNTPVPPTDTPTNTPVPPTDTPTNTPVPPTDTPTNTPGGPTNTPRPTDPPAPPVDPSSTPEPSQQPTDLPTTPPTSGPGATPTNTPLLPTATPVDADPRLEKVVNVSGPMAQGSQVIYTLRIWSVGTVASTDVIATDQLPAGLKLIAADSTRGEVRISGNTVSVILGNVAPGEEVFVTITATLDGAPGETITNRAVLTTSSKTDIVPNNEDDARVSILTVRSTPAPTRVPPAVNRRIPTTDSVEGIQLPIGLLGVVALGVAAAIGAAAVGIRRYGRS